MSWIRVNKEHPCPICGKTDWCTVSSDGALAVCPRIQEGSIREIVDSGYLHCVSGAPKRELREEPKDRMPYEHWTRLAFDFARNATPWREELGRQLSVSEKVLQRLGIGYSAKDAAWTIPERDDDGRIIGIQRRYPDGAKRHFQGGARGLVFSLDIEKSSGPILLPEGASDTAACLSAGIDAVGRPSCVGGIKFLSPLLRRVAIGRQVIVVGERDQKSNKEWPGFEGAQKTARRLATELGRSIKAALCCRGFKDVRQWYAANQSADAKALLASLGCKS